MLLGIFDFSLASKLQAEVINIDAQELNSKDSLLLKGPWEFFWAEWIEPGDHRSAPLEQMAGRSWDPPADSRFRKGEGFASYRLPIKNLQALEHGYSLAIRSASTAMKIFIYPKNHPEKIRTAAVGRIGLNTEDEIPQLRLTSLHFYPEAGESEWIILVHISNFHYSRGGLWTAPILGLGSVPEERLYRDREFIMLCLGMIGVIGIYNIVLYLRRREDRSTLMLAVFCSVVSIRTFVTENLISWYFPQIHPWVYLCKYFLEYITMILGPLACISFVHLSFPKSTLPRFFRGVLFVSLVAVILIGLLDNYSRSLLVVGFQIVCVFQVSYGLTVLTRAALARSDESWLSAGGGFLLAFCVVYDIMITFDIFPQPYITQFGMTGFVFLQSQVVAKRFSKAFRVAEHLSLGLKEEVERQTVELRSIMENIPQGVFIMLADRTIQGNYSIVLEQLLGDTNLTGKPALPLLFRDCSVSSEDLSIMDSILINVIDEPLYAWELNSYNLPHELYKVSDDGHTNVLEIEWDPIVNSKDLVDRILVTLRNVTELRDLQDSQKRNQEAFDQLVEIVHVSPSRFHDFIQQSLDILQQCQNELKSVGDLRNILIRLHTWKGLARSFRFKHLTAHIHESEHLLKQIQGKVPESEESPEQILDRLLKVLLSYSTIEKERLGRSSEHSSLADATPESKALIAAWNRWSYQSGDKQKIQLQKALENFVAAQPGITAGQLIHGLQGELESLAQELGKPLPHLNFKGQSQRPLPGPLYKSLSYILQHLIRNSMDHGLETTEERKNKGKNEQGQISIQLDFQQGFLHLDYQDDGRGLDLERMLRKAVVTGIVPPHTRLNPRETAQLIFTPGFSTKESVNMISGRGIGMDAVRFLIDETKGEMELVLPSQESPASTHLPFHLRASWSVDEILKICA